MTFEHKPVMLDECIDYLNIRADGIYVDATVGGAGHSSGILERLGPKGLLVGIDQDQDAIRAAGQRLEKVQTQGRYVLCNTNFENIREVLGMQKIKAVDGVLMDLVFPPTSWMRGNGGSAISMTHPSTCG